MGKNLFEQLENRGYWGVVGVLLTIVFGVVGLYSYFHERKPNIQVEVVGESNVLDLHKPLDDLTIYFNNEDIQKNNLNLRIINIQISNNGEIDILQSQFDQQMKWGIKISNGKIINDARIVSANSDYLKSALSPKVIGDDVVELEKVIFEKGKYFSIEILVLHSKDTLPEIITIGKIAGQDKIQTEKTWETKMRPSFLKTFFIGGLLVNLLRFISSVVIFVILIILIGLTVDSFDERKKKIKKNRREREVESLFGKDPQDEHSCYIREIYIRDGLPGLKEIDDLLNDDKKLFLTIKRFTLEQEHEAKVEAIRPVSVDEESIFQEEHEYFASARFRKYWHRPRVEGLLKRGIIKLTSQDAVEIDAKFREILLRTIEYVDHRKKLGTSPQFFLL